MEHSLNRLTVLKSNMRSELQMREAGKSENLKTTLMEERDAKIDDIRKNFESDAYVEAKIRAE